MQNMRRKFLQLLGVGAASYSVTACNDEPSTTTQSVELAHQQTFEWKMITTWPKNFPGLGTGAEFLAQTIKRNVEWSNQH